MPCKIDGVIAAAQQTSRTIVLTVDKPKRVVSYYAMPWVYDPAAGTITDGYWTFAVKAEGRELTISNLLTVNPDHVVIDFTKPIEGGYEIVDILNGPNQSNLEDHPVDFTDELLLPKTLRRLHSWALCHFMPPIVLPPDNLITNLGGKAFGSESADKPNGLCGDIVLNKIEHLENQAFYRCKNVTSLTLGKKLQDYPSVYSDAANDTACFMSSMTNLVLKGMVLRLGAYAFCGNSALKEWHWAAYPESIAHESNWILNTKNGTGVRMFIPRGCAGWEEKIAASTFTPWIDCTSAQQSEYFVAFGQNARKPIGYATSPTSAWLIYEGGSGLIFLVK